ncbi:hypothetical protein [Priestia aryabhattai]|uniref:hypothetical protein n=1 Tax=Priestia aryabhattai TaxID=412384 RepID=UPI002E1C773F|nr:hypothetical protein [Priestia aryabhattai]
MRNITEWTNDEIIYIIYKHGGVVQRGAEEKFVNNFSDETVEKTGFTRQYLINIFIEMNEIISEEIGNYYQMDLTLHDVLEAEAAQYKMTVEELLRPVFDKTSFH